MICHLSSSVTWTIYIRYELQSGQVRSCHQPARITGFVYLFALCHCFPTLDCKYRQLMSNSQSPRYLSSIPSECDVIT